MVDTDEIGRVAPAISQASIETLLTIISARMLVIATFAVASMVAAYASASNTATPRAFSVVVSDDVSQNSLSTFIGAFISSVVALIALQNGYFGKAGRFALFILTLMMLAMIIVTVLALGNSISNCRRCHPARRDGDSLSLPIPVRIAGLSLRLRLVLALPRVLVLLDCLALALGLALLLRLSVTFITLSRLLLDSLLLTGGLAL
jgi:hypothetical protein